MPWVAWGGGIGLAAGVTFGVLAIARSPNGVFLIPISPVLVGITGAVGALGGIIVGDVACGIRYIGREPS